MSSTICGLWADLAFRYKREKRPLYLSTSYEVISSARKIDGLQISLNGVAIPSLHVTRLAFWNSGRETIHGTDLVSGDLLRIEPTLPIEILGAKLSHTHRPATAVTIAVDQKRASLSFEFLDHNDGCVVDIYHAAPATFRVLGTIKGSVAPADARVAGRYKADRAMDYFFENVPKSIRNLSPLVATALILPFYLPIRLISLPFGIAELLLRPLRLESWAPPEGFDLK